ncbi:MAG: glucose-1-phosphate thymidylyltransferase RfbA [Erysipelotrichaceae bacterium]
MKGIILAGGTGSRLYPMTKSVSKQLLPIYDKPMIYYPLSVLLLSGIREMLIISSPDSINQYEQLLGNGNDIGIQLSYVVQEKPKGLAEAFILGEKFIGNDSVCLVLGDNIFFGQDFSNLLNLAKTNKNGATIFGYPVNNPKEFGVVEFDKNGNVLSLEEKPVNPKSSYAIPGLYFYDNEVVKIAKAITPSDRGELEITSINNWYLKEKKLNVVTMGRGMAWLDTGTPKGMLQASQFVETVQERQGFYISCIEEIAWRRGFIDYNQLMKCGERLEMTDYGKYILSLREENK